MNKNTRRILATARRGGLVVVRGRAHFKVLTREGSLVTVLPFGDRAQQFPDRRNYSLQAIERAIKEQEES